MADVSKITLPTNEEYNIKDSYAREQIKNLNFDETVVPLYEGTTLTSTDQQQVLTFNSEAKDIPLQSVKVRMEPRQDLHGYDYPWPGGGGKNILPLIIDAIKANNTVGSWTGNNYTRNGITFSLLTDDEGNVIGISANGTATADAQFGIYIDASNGNYYFNGCSGGSSTTYNIYAWDPISSVRAKKWNGTTNSEPCLNNEFQEFKIQNNHSIRISCRVHNTYTARNVLFTPMVCVSTETDPTFQPYSNICPASGWTGCNIMCTGKNLLQRLKTVGATSNGITYTINNDENLSVTISGTATADSFFAYSLNSSTAQDAKPFRGKRLTASIYPSGDNVLAYLSYFKEDGEVKSFSPSSTNSSATFTVPDEAVGFRILFQVKNGKTVNNTYTLMLRFAEIEDNTFEPYSRGTTIPIVFPSNVGTVYGGTPDVTTGVLAVDRVSVDLGALTWTANSGNTYFTASLPTNILRPEAASAEPDMICSIYKTEVASRIVNSSRDKVIGLSTTSYTIFIRDTSYTTGADLKASLTGQTAVLRLTEPVTYQLTPQEVTTLLGTNHMWTDADGIEVIYGEYLEAVKEHADTVGDNILSAIAPLEISYVASKNYSVGDFLFVGTKFYKVISSITSGATITPDTNVEQTTIAAQLKLLATNT